MWLKRSEYLQLVKDAAGATPDAMKPLVDEFRAMLSEVRGLRTALQRNAQRNVAEQQPDTGPVVAVSGRWPQ
jgi:hypothetical protein